MIQRIQSVYLLLTTIFSAIFLNGNFVSFTDSANNAITVNLQGLVRTTDTGTQEQIGRLMPYSLFLFIIPVISLTVIFLFRNSKLQMKLVLVNIFLIILLLCGIAIYSVKVTHAFNVEIKPGISLIFPVLMLICSWLAYRSIRNDEKLIKSYDRMR